MVRINCMFPFPKLWSRKFLGAMSKDRASRDLNIFLFCQIGLFVAILIWLSEFWFVCQNFDIARSLQHSL